MKVVLNWMLIGLASLSTIVLAQDEQLSDEQYLEWAQTFWESLDRRHGQVKLDNAVATLRVPQNFYYLSPADAEKVLVEVWGNPPGAGETTLGMLFPEERTAFDEESWAVIIEYVEDGYFSDENADEIDCQELLAQMKEDAAAVSEDRISQGYESIWLGGRAALRPSREEDVLGKGN